MQSQRTKNEQDLVMVINRLSRIYRRAANQALSGQGIPDAQAIPVMFISRLGGGIRQKDLAELLGVAGPSLGRQLDYLETAGLVQRRDDPHDHRAKTLHLTASGQSYALKIEELLRERRGQFLGGLNDEIPSITLGALRQIEAAVDAALGQPPTQDKA